MRANQARVNVHAGVGAGKFRHPWRIREYLDGIGSCAAAIARDLGIDPSTISRTISGKGNNRKVLEELRRLGVPNEFLSLPEDMRL